MSEQAAISNLTEENGATVDLYAQWKNIYEVIEGVNLKVLKGDSSDVVFRVDGDYDKFTGIQIDDRNIASNQYASWSGSTFVQLNRDYINQMEVGKHTINFIFTDGSVENTFEIVDGSSTVGSAGQSLLWIIIVIVIVLIIIAVIVIIVIRRKKNQKTAE